MAVGVRAPHSMIHKTDGTPAHRQGSKTFLRFEDEEKHKMTPADYRESASPQNPIATLFASAVQ